MRVEKVDVMPIEHTKQRHKCVRAEDHFQRVGQLTSGQPVGNVCARWNADKSGKQGTDAVSSEKEKGQACAELVW